MSEEILIWTRGGIPKVNFTETLSIFGEKCPQNGSKNGLRAPRTGMGCPHIGPSVEPLARNLVARRRAWHMSKHSGHWPTHPQNHAQKCLGANEHLITYRVPRQHTKTCVCVESFTEIGEDHGSCGQISLWWT